MKFKKFYLKNLRSKDNTYTLTPVELKEFIDFEVKRVYFITDVSGDQTGQHCHYKEKEFFIMIQGRATAVIDKGDGLEEFEVGGPRDGFYAGNYVWHGFKNLSKDAIILALSSTNYDSTRQDYQENYEEYLKVREEGLKE